MKVYLVIEGKGEYEEYQENITKAFCDEEKAEKFKNEKITQNVHNYVLSYKCSKCPAYWVGAKITKNDYCENITSCRKYDCSKYISCDYDSMTYRIEELEVEE